MTIDTSATFSEAAFEDIYQTYYAKVFAFVYSRVGDVEQTKDLTAQTFQFAYVKGGSLRSAAACGAWLFAIARNVVYSHYRERQRKRALADRLEDDLRLADRLQRPDDHLLQSERVSHLMREVRTLPRRDQEILSLKFDGELTNAEIARVMHMTEVNVRVSVFRALGKLRERMRGETDGAFPGRLASSQERPSKARAGLPARGAAAVKEKAPMEPQPAKA